MTSAPDPNDYPLTLDLVTLSARIQATASFLVEAGICAPQEWERRVAEIRGNTRSGPTNSG